MRMKMKSAEEAVEQDLLWVVELSEDGTVVVRALECLDEGPKERIRALARMREGKGGVA